MKILCILLIFIGIIFIENNTNETSTNKYLEEQHSLLFSEINMKIEEKRKEKRRLSNLLHSASTF
jgi:hypothetical protein